MTTKEARELIQSMLGRVQTELTDAIEGCADGETTAALEACARASGVVMSIGDVLAATIAAEAAAEERRAKMLAVIENKAADYATRLVDLSRPKGGTN